MTIKTIIVRIRRESGCKGGSNHYHHADVICKSKKEALEAAKDGRVRNWRWIDRFDKASKTYEHFEVLYTLKANEATNPHRPISKKQNATELKATLKAPK